MSLCKDRHIMKRVYAAVRKQRKHEYKNVTMKMSRKKVLAQTIYITKERRFDAQCRKQKITNTTVIECHA